MKYCVEQAISQPGEIFRIEGDEVLCDQGELGEIPVRLQAQYYYEGNALYLSGSFETEICAVCARCLTDMRYPMKVDFSEVYKREPDLEEEYPITENEITLDPMILDQIFLNLPSRFLCKPDCKGLCPQCGANLNEGSCACKDGKESETTTNPFAKLKGLFDENEEV